MPGVFVCLGFGFWVLGFGCISVSPGAAAGGFALTASPFFKRQKGTKRLCPGVRHFAEAQCSLATVSIRGHRLRFASLHLLSMYAASPHGATRLPPGWTPPLGLPKGLKIKSQIKSQSQSQSRSKDRSLRQLLHGIGCFQLEIGRLSGRHRWQASSHNFIRAHPMRRSRPTQHDER